MPEENDTPAADNKVAPSNEAETSQSGAPAAEPAADTTATTSALPPVPADPGYTSAGVPTFEAVREKIETRYGTAIGSVELESDTATARRVEEQFEERQRKAAEKLDEIRRSMRHDSGDES